MLLLSVDVTHSCPFSLGFLPQPADWFACNAGLESECINKTNDDIIADTINAINLIAMNCNLMFLSDTSKYFRMHKDEGMEEWKGAYISAVFTSQVLVGMREDSESWSVAAV